MNEKHIANVHACYIFYGILMSSAFSSYGIYMSPAFYKHMNNVLKQDTLEFTENNSLLLELDKRIHAHLIATYPSLQFNLSFHDLRTRYLKILPVLVSQHDSVSLRVFSNAFGAQSGYVCLDAILGRCMLAVSELRDGNQYFVYDGISSTAQVEAFFADGSTEITVEDEGRGIIRLTLKSKHCLRFLKDVCQLLYRHGAVL